MYKVKIYGAGSIGNHLAHAARSLEWDVSVCDVSEEALGRMRTDIYPSRYGEWDPSIKLYDCKDESNENYDFIFIGTPPDSHIPLALKALREKPKAILIEKPLCPPSLDGAEELWQATQNSKTKVFVGYDHVVGRAALKTVELFESGIIGEIRTIDVAFREHWRGIFDAHPWLSGPEDSYLGFWELGGGASGEHSHAINLWQHLAHKTDSGRITEVEGTLNYIREDKAAYDDICLMNVRTESGLVGRVVQDVISLPARKYAILQGSLGYIKWVNGYNAEGDAVIVYSNGQEPIEYLLPKPRPDDFIEELKHLSSHVSATIDDSDIRLERGLDTMLVVAGAHLSEVKKRRVCIDYTKGYCDNAFFV